MLFYWTAQSDLLYLSSLVLVWSQFSRIFECWHLPVSPVHLFRTAFGVCPTLLSVTVIKLWPKATWQERAYFPSHVTTWGQSGLGLKQDPRGRNWGGDHSLEGCCLLAHSSCFLFKDSLARSRPTHSGLGPPTPFINQEDVPPTGTICISFRKLLIFSLMFSMPLERDSSFVLITHRSGLFTSVTWVLEFSVLSSPSFVFVVIWLFQFLGLIFKLRSWSLPSPWSILLLRLSTELFMWIIIVFTFNFSIIFLQYFCIFLKFLFLVLHQLSYFIKLFVIFSIRRLFSQQYHWSNYPYCSIIK